MVPFMLPVIMVLRSAISLRHIWDFNPGSLSLEFLLLPLLFMNMENQDTTHHPHTCAPACEEMPMAKCKLLSV